MYFRTAAVRGMDLTEWRNRYGFDDSTETGDPEFLDVNHPNPWVWFLPQNVEPWTDTIIYGGHKWWFPGAVQDTTGQSQWIDTTELEIEGVGVDRVTDTSATIVWSTNKRATSQVHYGTTHTLDQSTSLDSRYVTGHVQQLTGLSPGTVYYYKVASREYGQAEIRSEEYQFTTDTTGSHLPHEDTIPPVISGGLVIDVTALSATVVWTTDEPATSQVLFGPTEDYGLASHIDHSLKTDHSVTIDDLSPSTTYHCLAVSVDSADNTGLGRDITFTTPSVSTDTEGSLVATGRSTGTIYDVRPTLRVYNINENPGNEYVFILAHDSDFVYIIESSPPLSQQEGSKTSWEVSEALNRGETYYWQAAANSEIFSEIYSFTVKAGTFLYPNPFRLSETSQVIFSGVPQGGAVLILTVSGEFVRRLVNESGGELHWDGSNESGNTVASGTYLWYVENGNDKGKVIVIN
jgi:hypothetical protein